MSSQLSQGQRDAAAILASTPSVLARVATLVGYEGDARQIDWTKIAELGQEKLLPTELRAFLALLAQLAHTDTDGPSQNTFGANWDALDASHQAVIAGILTSSAHSKRMTQRSLLQGLGLAGPDEQETRNTRGAIRVRLQADHPAVVNDALGRERVGYRDGASPQELWLRGRGVWRLQPDRVMASKHLLITHAGIVRLIGTIDGVTIHGDRLAIIGTPLPAHPLIGKSDPLDNASQNPVAYGEIDDVR